MRFGHWLKKTFKKAGHDITHPKSIIKKIDQGIKKAEKGIVNVATKVEKVGAKAIHEARNVTHFVAKNAKVIDTIIDVAATAADGVAMAVGQPELVAGIETLRGLSKKAVDATEKADKVINTAEKFVHVATAIKHKENVSVIMRQTADAFTSAGELSGNPQLQHVAKQLTKGADITEKVVDHSKAMLELGKAGHKAIKDKDIKGVIKTAEGVVKQTKQIKKDVQSMKQHKAPPHPGTSGVTVGKPTTKTTTTKTTKKQKAPSVKELKAKAKAEGIKGYSKMTKKELEEIFDLESKGIKVSTVDESKLKPTKAKRAPSAYNKFVQEKRKEGMSMKEIGAAWKATKK